MWKLLSQLLILLLEFIRPEHCGVPFILQSCQQRRHRSQIWWSWSHYRRTWKSAFILRDCEAASSDLQGWKYNQSRSSATASSWFVYRFVSSFNAPCDILTSFKIDQILLCQFFAGDGIFSIVCYVLDDEPLLVQMTRLFWDHGYLWWLTRDCCQQYSCPSLPPTSTEHNNVQCCKEWKLVFTWSSSVLWISSRRLRSP